MSTFTMDDFIKAKNEALDKIQFHNLIWQERFKNELTPETIKLVIIGKINHYIRLAPNGFYVTGHYGEEDNLLYAEKYLTEMGFKCYREFRTLIFQFP